MNHLQNYQYREFLLLCVMPITIVMPQVFKSPAFYALFIGSVAENKKEVAQIFESEESRSQIDVR